MDDACARKDPVNDSKMQKIAQVFVDDASRPGRQTPQTLERCVGDALIVARRRGIGRLRRGLERRAQAGSFAGTVDIGMRGNDLLHQGGTRARHADDKHRQLGKTGAREALLGGEPERPGGDRCQLVRRSLRIEVDARALHAVAPVPVQKGGVGIFTVHVRLAEREMQQNFVPIGTAALEQLLHGADVGIVGGVALRVRLVVPGVRQGGLVAQRLIERGTCLGQSPELGQQHRLVRQSRRGAARSRAIEHPQSFLVLAGEMQGKAVSAQ